VNLTLYPSEVGIDSHSKSESSVSNRREQSTRKTCPSLPPFQKTIDCDERHGRSSRRTAAGKQHLQQNE
jgi:hypothetical protein